MNFFPFKTVTNYSEMLFKIASFNFLVSILILAYLDYHIPKINTISNTLSFKVDAFGLSLPLGLVVPSFFNNFFI